MTVHVSDSPPGPQHAQRPPRSPHSSDRSAPARGRLGRLALEIVKFGIVGGSGVAVNFVVFNLLLHAHGTGPMTATVLASCAAMASNYLGFRFFAYRDRAARTQRQVVLFFAFSGLGVLLESLLFSAAYHGAQLTGPLASNAAKALSIGLASAFRFLVYRTWVFPHDPHDPPDQAHQPHQAQQAHHTHQAHRTQGPDRGARRTRTARSPHRARPLAPDTLPGSRRPAERAAERAARSGR
ncbi:GtrA family protein [Streptomyces sp. NPDC058171]